MSELKMEDKIQILTRAMDIEKRNAEIESRSISSDTIKKLYSEMKAWLK